MASQNRTQQIRPLVQRDEPTAVAQALMDKFWPGKDCTSLAAGSWQRGQETETSDIDLVVLLPEGMKGGYRFSCIRGGWPVEVFVHDDDSLQCFITSDIERGMPSLLTMICEGQTVGGVDEAGSRVAALKHKVAELLREGPPALTLQQLENRRYGLTDLCDDLAAPRSPEEAVAVILKLAPQAADFWLRANGFWSGEGKALLRALSVVSGDQAEAWHSAVHSAVRGTTAPLIDLVEGWMEPFGGRLFDGYMRGKPNDGS